RSNRTMPNRKWLPGLLVVLAISLAAAFFYFHYTPDEPLAERNEMLARMPTNGSAVVFLDLTALRSSPFLAQLFAWAPRPAPDADYAQFVQATGFDYERDLDRVAIGVFHAADRSSILVIADGRFDRQKIPTYLQRSGKPAVRNGATIFSIAPAGTAGASFLAFLREDRIAWTNDPSPEALFWQRYPFAAEWRERFGRLSGTPAFAVIRQDSGAAADGECDSETTMRQLSEFLNGILLLAQGGLNGADTRKKLDPQLREGYLELLQSAEVQKVDRGTSKSVRVV